jgi:hypothetical protein
MTVERESFALPAIFLTVALLGGLRIAETVRLMAPSLMAMVLAMLLMGCLVRARALAPDRLMNAGRSALENVSGLVVLLTLFAACAQVFNLVTPETGLLFLLFSVFFLVQLLTTLAAVRERVPLLQALAVLFGAAFVIRFIGLEALYSQDGGTLKRVLTALMEGVTLGAIEYQSHAPATGYVAFFTLSLFLVGVIMLPFDEASWRPGLPYRTRLDAGDASKIARQSLPILLVLCGTQWACSGTSPAVDAAVSPAVAAARDAALVSARVWRQPDVPVSEARLGANPAGGWQPTEDVSCTFVFETVGGMTPKFDCQLPDGQIVKVKYGRSNEELYTEVAATRLLAALGFGSDRMFVVRSVRCSGCPSYPYVTLQCLRKTGLRRPCAAAGLGFGQDPSFEYVALERRMPGRTIEAHDGQGWAWFELDKIDPARGGSPRDEVDALRLLAVFLAHWDNKSDNQRLVCPPGGDRPDGACATPMAIMHDVGGTFGPAKLDLHNWRKHPVWADAKTCKVSMESLPYEGATFPEGHISEGGRQKLLSLIEQLPTQQIEELFTASRMTQYDAVSVESRNPKLWVRAFLDKIRQIREAGPCPDRPLFIPSAG